MHHSHEAEDLGSNMETSRQPHQRTLTNATSGRHCPLRNHAILLELHGPQPGAVFSIPESGITIGGSSSADVFLNDDSVSQQHVRVTFNGNPYVEDLASQTGTFINGERVERRKQLLDGDYISVGQRIIFKFSMVDEFEEQAHRALFELTMRDPLTQLYNRQYFDDSLFREFMFAQRHGTELGLLLIDVDHFKQINDTHGHPTGDAVLKLVASKVQETMRSEDAIARYGGDEFVIIVRASSLQSLESLAARTCERVRTARIVSELGLPVTISIGVACLSKTTPYASPRALLLAADDALYAAKEAGRDGVSSYPPPADEPLVLRLSRQKRHPTIP
jgi:diguanylate cyclase (GGDEF)-like protein